MRASTPRSPAMPRLARPITWSCLGTMVWRSRTPWPWRCGMRASGPRRSTTSMRTPPPLRSVDGVEVKAIKHLFGRRASQVAINATKSLVGHTLGAAGALAGIVCALTIDTSLIHPTINYDDPDPDCALPGILERAQERSVGVALLNAFGFGSNNATVVFKQCLT